MPMHTGAEFLREVLSVQQRMPEQISRVQVQGAMQYEAVSLLFGRQRMRPRSLPNLWRGSIPNHQDILQERQCATRPS